MSISKILSWAARVVGGLVALVAVAYGAVYAVSVKRANASVMVPAHFTTTVDFADSALVAEGARLAHVRGCVDCHGANLGGKLFIDDPMIGTVYASNLTRGGRGAELAPEHWELAIRHGVRADGSKLAVMPAMEYNELTDADVAALVAYARSVPAVEGGPFPAPALGPLGRALFVAGKLPAYSALVIEHPTTHRAAIVPEVSAEFGKYVVHSCTGCHGPNFSGGKIPGPPDAPLAANLTPDSTGLLGWTEADFIRALREGVRPDGRKLAPFMPVALTSHMTDTELKAAFMYLQSLPPVKHGVR